MGLSLIPQPHGGALLSGGKTGTRGPNQNARQRAAAVRAGLVSESEGAAKDLSALLETARESDGDRLRCKACGSFIPGVSKLKLGDILAVIREHEVAAYLESDADLLREYLGEQRGGLKVVKA
ncbi:MAG: hypothetical protein IIA55_03255 [Gemmatimonadetes bacterium]|nr:hypothetical protein [Gemmatimonadota bacterium]